MMISKATQEFSRFAHSYGKHNMIQAEVAKRVVSKLPSKAYRSVLDLGCGNGEVYKCFQKAAIESERFVAFDSSLEMLSLHPSGLPMVEKIHSDFNKEKYLSRFYDMKFDVIVSSSALQWSRDLDMTLGELAKVSERLHAAIFTSGTFKTIQEESGTESPIYDAETLKNSIEKHYTHAEFEIHKYTLEFDSKKEIFSYIKRSGVSGGEKKLNYREIKNLIRTYPLMYLEFEVLFVEASNSRA